MRPITDSLCLSQTQAYRIPRGVRKTEEDHCSLHPPVVRRGKSKNTP